MRNLKNLKKSDRGFVGRIVVNHDTPWSRNHSRRLLDHPVGQGEWIRGYREDGLNYLNDSSPWPKPFSWIVGCEYDGFADRHVHYDTTLDRKGWAVIGHIEWDDDFSRMDSRLQLCITVKIIWCDTCIHEANSNAACSAA